MAKHPQKHLFPELDEIVTSILAGKSQDLLVLFIPSHTRKQIAIANQDQWAHAALELFARLYGGATAFQTFAGVYRDDDGTILEDRPIVIQAYVQRTDLLDKRNRKDLAAFCIRVGRETNQAAVGLVVNHVFIAIKRFSAGV